MKSFLAMMLILATVLCLLAGCNADSDVYVPTGDGLGGVDEPPSDTRPADQTLCLTYYREKTMNPLFCDDYTNKALFSLLYQGLFCVDRNYKVEPMLCKSYRMTPDMRSYTFYIENAAFSDGTPVTGNDVVATLKAAMESPIYSGRFLHIDAVTLLEDGGVEVRMDTPCENLPLLLDIPILPANQLNSLRPLGSGPYLLDENGSVTRLRRVGNWWCDSSLVGTASSITVLDAQSNTQIRDNFQFYDLDLTLTDPGSDRFADYRCDYELWNCESGIFLFLACSVDSPVFSNPQVKAALTYAIDRDYLVKEFYRDYAQAVTLPASPQFPYYNKNLAEKYTFDSVRFAAAVSDAGLVGAEVKLLVNSGDSLRIRVARAIANMLSDCGLKVTVNELTGNNYTYAVQTRAFDLYLGQTILSPNMDLSAFFHTYGALSFGGVNDVTAYSLCLESLANHGNYYSLHKYVMENGSICPVLFRNYAVFATRGLLTGLTPARDNVFYYSAGKNMEQALLRSE